MADLPDQQALSHALPPEYDWRYLVGIVRFNKGEYFDAHEIWEELWLDCPAVERRFYQSLIQAAVALYHWGNGNLAGATRLFESGRKYMTPYCPTHLGLAVDPFWSQIESVIGPALEGLPKSEIVDPDRQKNGELPLPRIELVPPPANWPNHDEVRHD